MKIEKLSNFDFISSMYIYNKQSSRLSFFDLNSAQHQLLEVLQSSNRIIIPKARQLGISTLIRAYFFKQAYCAVEPQTWAVISHTYNSAEHLARMDKTFYKHLPPKCQKPLSKSNTRHTIFGGSGAGLSVYTAGGRGGTRSFSASAAHLSEFAFYADQEEVLAQTLATVGEGQVVIESTPNTAGDKFHQLIEESLRGENDWTVLFLPWFSNSAYRATPKRNYKPTKVDLKLMDEHGLDIEQIYWRRKQIQTLGIAKFRREYPGTIEECFMASSTPWFDRESLKMVEAIPSGKNRVQRALKEPNPQERYIMGVDVSAGVGSDYSAITVISLATRQPVYHYESNEIRPTALADVIVRIADMYNEAIVLVEANEHGRSTLTRLEMLGYRNLWTDEKGNYFTQRKATRTPIFEMLRDQIENRSFDALDERLIEQMKLFHWDEVKQRPDHPKGQHDDLLMSFGLALWGCKDIPLSIVHNIRANLIESHKRKQRIKRLSRSIPWRPTVPRNRSPY